MGGDLDVADDGLEAGGGLGEDGGEEVFGAGCAGFAALCVCPSTCEAVAATARRPTTPARLEMGEAMAACSRSSLAVCSVRKWKTSESGKLCCSAREMLMPLSVAAACNSKLKPRQSAAQGEAPGLVDAAAERGVEDELHAATFVEEALRDDGGFWKERLRGRRGR